MRIVKWIYLTAIIVLAAWAYATGNVDPQDIGKGFVMSLTMLLVLAMHKSVQRLRRRRREKVVPPTKTEFV